MDKLSEDKLFLELQEAHLQPIEHNMEVLDEAVAKRKSLGKQLKTINKIMTKLDKNITQLSNRIKADANSNKPETKTIAANVKKATDADIADYNASKESYKLYSKRIMPEIAEAVDSQSTKDGKGFEDGRSQNETDTSKRSRDQLTVADLTKQFKNERDINKLAKTDIKGNS